MLHEFDVHADDLNKIPQKRGNLQAIDPVTGRFTNPYVLQFLNTVDSLAAKSNEYLVGYYGSFRPKGSSGVTPLGAPVFAYISRPIESVTNHYFFSPVVIKNNQPIYDVKENELISIFINQTSYYDMTKFVENFRFAWMMKP